MSEPNGCATCAIPVAISLFDNEKDNRPKGEVLTWGEHRPRLLKVRLREEKSGHAWSPVRYTPGVKRGNGGVEIVSVAVMDVDDGTDPQAVHDMLSKLGVEHVVHSTHSSTPDHPKFRVAVPLAQPVPAAKWSGLFPAICAYLTEGHTDPGTCDPARIFYLPSAKPGGRTFTYQAHGRALRLDELPVVASSNETGGPRPSARFEAGPEGKIPHGRHHDFIISTAASFASRIAGISEPELLRMTRAAVEAAIDDADRHVGEISDAVRSAIGKFGKPAAVSNVNDSLACISDYSDLFRSVLKKDGSETLEPMRAAFVSHLETEYSFAAMRDTGELHVYRDGMYEPDGKRTVETWVEDRSRERGTTPSARFVEETVGSIKRAHFVPREEFNPSGFLPTLNGVLDLRDPKNPAFLPHDPARKFTFKLAVEFDAAASCAEFEGFILRILPGEQARGIVQEEFGYTLTPGNPYKVAAFWVGPPDCGKSTLHAVLRGVLGRKNVSAVSLQSLSENRFAPAALYGKLANLVSDLPVRAVRDVGKFKELVGGGDEIQAEKKGLDLFFFINGAKLLYAANELPAVPWGDDAFFRRWALTVFSVSIPLEEQIEDYAPHLVEREGSGILNWMLVGLARLKARGRFASEALEGAATTWRRHSNSLVAFVEERLEADRDSELPKDELWSEYVSFCEDRDFEPLPKATLGRELPLLVRGARATFPKVNEKSVRSWKGVRIKSPGESESSTLSTGSTGCTSTTYTRAGGWVGVSKPPVESVEPVEDGTARRPLSKARPRSGDVRLTKQSDGSMLREVYDGADRQWHRGEGAP
jgi:putative DNA primase/helicase